MNHVEEFFTFAAERYRIMLRREAGLPFPWTDDPVLRDFYFCNVFREDDRVTTWFRKNVREPLRDNPERVTLATIGFRWFNRIETGERILPMLLAQGWDTPLAKLKLTGVQPLITGAYMIKSPTGMNKLDGLCWCMDQLGNLRDVRSATTLEHATEALAKRPFLGPFLAYEVVTDLRHTVVLEHASDIMTWANAGPGAVRGLNYIFGTKFVRNRRDDILPMLRFMRELLAASRTLWPWHERPWEMREVEHTLCEFSKYKEGQAGEKLKRRYAHDPTKSPVLRTSRAD